VGRETCMISDVCRYSCFHKKMTASSARVPLAKVGRFADLALGRSSA
jgi:hypothetical protein